MAAGSTASGLLRWLSTTSNAPAAPPGSAPLASADNPGFEVVGATGGGAPPELIALSVMSVLSSHTAHATVQSWSMYWGIGK